MKLLKAWEVAELAGVTPDTVLRWHRKGQLKAIRLPSGALRFDQEYVEGWLRDREESGGPDDTPRI